ncbi:MAG: hypothetical protein M1839_007573 [Geoglossum umbratile]|nr:MAG: hypothetical protein M1839_007573 [Geoglossum umbratile]
MYPHTLLSFLGLTLTLISTSVLAVDKTVNPDLDTCLFTAPTQLDRLNLLPLDDDWLFDFTEQPSYTFEPGSVVNANAATFPAAVGNHLTMALINLGPCSILPPHYHPRASNYVVAVSGTTDTYFVQENGARLVRNTLTPGRMTIFPQASVHTMVNTGCTNAQLVSALSSEDAGTHNIANSLFVFPFNITAIALGFPECDLAKLAEGIPLVGTGSFAGSKECLAHCRIKY